MIHIRQSLPELASSKKYRTAFEWGPLFYCLGIKWHILPILDECGLEKLDPRNVKPYQQQFNFHKQPTGSSLVASQPIPSLGFQPINRLEFQPKSVIGAFIEESARTPKKEVGGGKQVEDEGYHSPVQQLQV